MEEKTKSVNLKFIEVCFLFDPAVCNIGLSIGKTKYSDWLFFGSLDILFFSLIVWFWKKEKKPNVTRYSASFEFETKSPPPIPGNFTNSPA